MWHSTEPAVLLCTAHVFTLTVLLVTEKCKLEKNVIFMKVVCDKSLAALIKCYGVKSE